MTITTILQRTCFSLVVTCTTFAVGEPPSGPRRQSAAKVPAETPRARWIREIKGAKRLFVAAETISRLGQEEQKQHLERVYKELFPQLFFLNRYHPTSSGNLYPFTPERSKWTPEKLADHILGMELGDKQLLWEGAKISREILSKNKRDFAPFVKADLESERREHKERALLIIRRFKLVDFFHSVLRIFDSDDDLSERAAETLSDLGDPRAIAPMVKKHPDLLVVSGKLRQLQQKQLAHPLLLRLLASQDPGIRQRAAFALAGSGDPKLVSYIPGLAKDDDVRVRKETPIMTSSMAREDFKKVRPAIVALLSDSNTEVRLITARMLVGRQDSVCASTLLSLLKDASISERKRNDVAGMIYTLTGSLFGYEYRGKASLSTMKSDKQAAKRFGEWIKNDAANESEDKPQPAPKADQK